MGDQELFDFLADVQDQNRDTLENEAYEKFGKTLAVVCIDSTGFSRTVKKKGITYYLTLIAHMRKIVTEKVEENYSVSYRSYADNFFAEFHNVPDAFKAVVDSCIAIREAGLMLDEDDPYQICVGIGFGPVLFSDREGPFGDQMNLASKLGEDTAEGGEILLTEEAFNELPQSLQDCFSKGYFSVSKVEGVFLRTTIDDVMHVIDK